MAIKPIPKTIPQSDDKGNLSERWLGYFQSIESLISDDVAPSNSSYIVRTADSTLTNEQVLADLATGYMKSTTGTGVVTTTATIPASDISGTLAVANGGTGITSLGTGIATWLGTPSSTNLRSAITDETGTGALVFATSPTFVTPLLGTPTSGTLTNCTGLTEAGLTLADNTTNNASTSNHGFLKKLDNSASSFMNGQGNWATPSGTGIALIQSVTTTATTFTTVNSDIPFDDTIPQNTEGTEVMTRSITPTNTNSRLRITVVAQGSCLSSAQVMTVALFQDSTANALATQWSLYAANGGDVITFVHEMTAGTTSSTTFKVRMGGNTASSFNITFNGYNGGRIYGGTQISRITVEEFAS